MSGGRLAISLVFLLTALAPSPARAGAPETVRFGVCLSLTGPFANFGNIYLSGIKLRLAEYNARAGKIGVRLEMLVRDDKSDPAIAAIVADELAARENVAAILGSSNSALTLAMLPKTREHGVPVIAPSATSVLLGKEDSGAVRVLFDDDFQGTALARFLRTKVGLKRSATITNRRYNYSIAMEQAFRREWLASGGEVVGGESYNIDLAIAERYDFTPLLMRLKAAGPEVVLLAGYAESVAAILRQSLKINFSPVFCGGDAWLRDTILVSSGNNVDGSYHIGFADENSRTPEMRAFMALLDKSNDTTAEPASVLGYDALSLLIEALRSGHSREDIRKALYRIKDFPLASGRITVDPERGTLAPAYIMKIVEKDNNTFVREVVDEIRP